MIGVAIRKQNAQVDDTATIQVANAVEDRRDPVGGAGKAVKMAIIRLYSMRPPQIQNSANQHHEGSQANTRAQHPADGDLHFQIGFRCHRITTFR